MNKVEVAADMGFERKKLEHSKIVQFRKQAVIKDSDEEHSKDFREKDI